MDIWIMALMAMNVFIYLLTRGRLGSKMAGQSVLLLHTVGHKSGAAYTTPINYYRDGEAYVVIASNWGKDSHPGWFYNLMHQGTATIQVKERKIRVRARQATGKVLSDTRLTQVWRHAIMGLSLRVIFLLGQPLTLD
jgi:deazaflavin-dependent oxidoreductase (nitroreductase family)